MTTQVEQQQRWIVEARYTESGAWCGIGPVHHDYTKARQYAADQSKFGVASRYRVVDLNEREQNGR